MEFTIFSRTSTGEVYTIVGENDEEMGELAVIYSELELQAIAGLSGLYEEDERDQIDLAIANFVENLTAAADAENFQLNIYASENVTAINNFDDDLEDEEAEGHHCCCGE